ncbi:subtilisin-like protease SBT1.7 isoform X2 [Prunus persica]|uniref:subtilisin-like protease SBT1.7 isoform X2 n=1 Tax=Prunus persica TaxID=3760 RepID=UPI0009AB9C1D|nr:subtilisin-like protease SBT1.7 isoform X2 [Prunus persica]
MKTSICMLSLTRMLMLLVLSHNILCTVAVAGEREQQTKKTYIIQMDKSKMPASFADDHFQWYGSSLKSVSNSADMLYTYKNVIHGFSTRLTAEEAELLERQSGILSVMPELRYELHTTRTPQFLGMLGGINEAVFPASEKLGKNFNSSSCNRKLIGARFFPKGYEASNLGPIDEKVESRSPRDVDGHGTQASTIAAGSAVPGASLYGYASGTARGMATQARVATYKACWSGWCLSSDILAAMDKAVEDGVHILSVSIGRSQYEDFYTDFIAIGAFSAMAKGVFVSCSAGNRGPEADSTSNNAPWITTVGAGTIDRDFPAHVSLGNGKKYRGASIYSGTHLSSGLHPLVYARNASNSTSDSTSDPCAPDSLIPEKVFGKIVVCDQGGTYSRVDKSMVVKKAGGMGMILADIEGYGEELVVDSYVLPVVVVGQKEGDAIKRYIVSHDNPKATFSGGKTELGVEPSPVVAAFSSRGPNPVALTVLKPDLIAPGVNILAGWTGALGPARRAEDTRRVSFNIFSGTSMSCPHVSGLAAVLKAAHPKWSPAAIKSALMTTSYATYKNGAPIKDVATGKPATPFDYGAGHVDPVAALDPGLVYDLGVKDYLNFLCAYRYTSSDIKILTHIDFTCDSSKNYSAGDLNYPSFAVSLNTNSGNWGAGTKIYTRTLTNVGTPGTYKVSVSTPSPAVKILVEPKSLSFTRAYEKKTYTVTFVVSAMPSGTNNFTRLEWSDGKHIVSSPIAVSWF